MASELKEVRKEVLMLSGGHVSYYPCLSEAVLRRGLSSEDLDTS